MTSVNPTSKFPPVKFNPAAEPGTVNAAVKLAEGTPVRGNSGVVMVPVAEIDVFPDLNVRVTGKAWHERVEELASDMLAHGFMATKPLTVFTVKEDRDDDGKNVQQDAIFVADGHTRLAAIQAANAQGAKIESVPVIFLPSGTTPEMVTSDLIRNNSGEPLSPWEQSVVVARMAGFGKSEEEIAASINRTKRYVQDLLILATAPPPIRNAVLKGEIAAAVAVREIRASGADKAAKKVAAAVDTAKASGKGKVTPSALKGEAKKTGKGKAGKAASGAKAAEGTETTPATGEAASGAPAVSDAAFLASALNYAVGYGKPSEGIAWIKKFLADDEGAISEFEKWMNQPVGSWKNPALRLSEADADDLSGL